jgi:alkaline phosphatase D
VWDDHETANDSWNGGAEHHDPKSEGPWIAREQAAMQAYYEWMPIREPAPGRAFEAINRSFQFGDLASLIMVETRLVGRTKQLSYARPEEIPMAVYSREDAARKPLSDPAIVAKVMTAVKAGQEPAEPYFTAPDVPALMALLNEPDRQMLGARQEEWLKLEIAQSVAQGRPWQILGNQVVMGRCNAPDIVKEIGIEKAKALVAAAPEAVRPRVKRYLDYFGLEMPYDLDGWDGYPAARERLFDAIKLSNANTVVVSGDSHSFWVNELFDAPGTTRVAAEFGTGSVTSPSLGESFRSVDMGKLFADQNKEVLFNEQLRHGYVKLTVTKDSVTGELVSTEITKKPYAAETFSTWRVRPGDGPGVGAISKV